MKNSLLLLIVLLFVVTVKAQLQPGFNKEEVIALLKVSAQFGSASYAAQMTVPDGYEKLYRSPIVGLDNCWELWRTDKGTPVISIRGTTKEQLSWLANFYAALIP